jgi:hypothetical protein
MTVAQHLQYWYLGEKEAGLEGRLKTPLAMDSAVPPGLGLPSTDCIKIVIADID